MNFRLLFTFSLFLIQFGLALGQDGFKITINTAEIGSSCNKCFTIPTQGTGYNYSVDWESDGIIDQTGITGNVTKTYSNSGTYTLTIRGNFPQIHFFSGNDRAKLLSIDQWGGIKWRSMEGAFHGCYNMEYKAQDKPDLSAVTDISNMFTNCSKFNANINDWETSTITKMLGVFEFANTFNQPLNNWNTANVTNMARMFFGAQAFNQNIENWNVNKVTATYYMFSQASAFNQPLNAWKVNNVNDNIGMFLEATAFNQPLDRWILNSGSTLNDFFSNSGLDCENYSRTIAGWASKSIVLSNKTLGADGLKYGSSVEPLRSSLVAKGWTFKGDSPSGTDCDQSSFIFTWKTDNEGTGCQSCVNLNVPGTNDKFDVDWNNDGIFEQKNVNSNLIHDFGTPGTYTIRIIGRMTSPPFLFGTTNGKLISIDRWGSNSWKSFVKSFANCTQLQINATDAPILDECTTISGVFNNSINFNSDISHWDVSNIKTMDIIFAGCKKFNKPLENWNISNVEVLTNAFQNAESFNQPLNKWNVAKAKNMRGMFSGAKSFNQPLDTWNVQNTTDLGNLFLNAFSFNQKLDKWNFNSSVNLDNLISNSGISCSNYSATLQAWAANPNIPSGKTFTATDILYPIEATTARNFLRTTKSWNIIGDKALPSSCNISTRPLVFEFKTDNDGTSCNSCITLDLNNTNSLLEIDWESDGIYDEITFEKSIIHDYITPGTYSVSIRTSKLTLAFVSNPDKLKLVGIKQWGDVNFLTLHNAFSGCINLLYKATDTPKLALVTSLSNMFSGCKSFNGNIGNWDVKSITSMGFMFSDATSFNQNLSGWDVRKVTYMESMFSGATAFNQSLGTWTFITNVNLKDFLKNTGLSCINYASSLNGWASNLATPKLISIGVTGLKYPTSAVASRNNLITNKMWTFMGDIALNSECDVKPMVFKIKTDNPGGSCPTCFTLGFTSNNNLYDVDWEGDGTYDQFNLKGKVTHNYGLAGEYTVKLAIRSNLDYGIFLDDSEKLISFLQWGEGKISGFHFFKDCKNMEYNATDNPIFWANSLYRMFIGCHKFNGDISKWDISNITSIYGIFTSATSFNQNINDWNVSNVNDFRYAFNGATSFNQPLDKWDVSKATSLDGLFSVAPAFNQDISSWNVSNVKSLNSTFSGAQSFNKNINNWDVSNVIDMSFLFFLADSFNQPLDKWNVSNVINFNTTFHSTKAFNQNINNWNVSKATSMYSMFGGCDMFNQPLNNWNVSNVRDFSNMFSYTINFNQNINNWNVSNATTMSAIFKSAAKFNQPLNNWEVSNVINFDEAFSYASSIDQELTSWTFKNNTSLLNFLSFSGMTCDNYSKTLMGWANNPLTPDNLQLGSSEMKYNSDGATARSILVNQKGWTITGDLEGNCDPVSPMVVKFKTDIPGGSCNSCVTLGGIVSNSLNVDWDNDGVFDETITTGEEVIHNYGIPGIYTIAISGDVLSNIFYNLDSIKLIFFEQWGNSNINGNFFFHHCTNLKYNATDAPNLVGASISAMFKGCRSFNGDISQWDISFVENISSLFSDATTFNQNINNWDVSNIKDFNNAFNNASSFNQPLDNWNVSKAENIIGLFSKATSFNQNINNWNTSKVKFLGGIFLGATSFNQPLDNWDVSNVENMSSIFFGAIKFNQNINNWNTSNVRFLQNAFKNAASFNQPLNNWNVSKVENMSDLFYEAKIFNQNINNWNTSNVKNLSNTFAYAFQYDQPLDNWDVSNVEDMSSIFFGAIKFNQNINAWKVNNVNNLSSAFAYASLFNQPLNNWNVNKATKMDHLFYGASSFNQNINNWDVSKVSDFFAMFYATNSFDQSLSDWTITSAANLEGFFDNSVISCENYSNTLKGWAANLNTPNNLSLGALSLKYNADGKVAHDFLTGTKGWSIVGDSYTGGSCDISSNIVWSSSSGNCTKDTDGKYKIKLIWSTAEYKNIDFIIEYISSNQDIIQIGSLDVSSESNGTTLFEFLYEVPDSIKSNPSNFRIKALGTDAKEYNIEVKVNPCEPVETIDIEETPSLFYPNPVLTPSSLTLKPYHDIIHVFNVYGKIIATIPANQSSWTVDVSPGTYILKESINNRTYKLIVVE